jgi:hypothetical protein
MKSRMDAINSLISSLRRIDGRTSPWDRDYNFNVNLHGDVYLGFDEDVNSFPIIHVLFENESIYSIGGGVRFSNIEIQLRCYTYDEAVEESAEAIASDVEHVLNHYRSWAPDLDDVRVIQIETDGGINAPYGAAIINIQVLFRR